MNRRVQQLKGVIKETNLDAVIITKPQNWRYLSGFTGSNAVLLITLNNEFIITDFRYYEQASQEAREFELVKAERRLTEALAEKISGLKLKRLGFEDTGITYFEYNQFKENLSDIELVPLHESVDKLRWVKDQREIEALKQAAIITDKTFDFIVDKLKPGVTELEIASEMEYFMRKNGAQKPAFDTIIASGYRAALPHGTASEKEIATGDLVVMDFGAVYDGYHADMTRTVVIGEPDEQQKQIYELVLKAQLKALNTIKSGVKCSVVDLAARELISDAGYGDNFGHGLGHSVGLEIHEKPSFSLKDDTILKDGMVLTVEPGVYLEGWGGVRIEDLVVVTSTGCEILSKSPKELIKI